MDCYYFIMPKTGVLNKTYLRSFPSTTHLSFRRLVMESMVLSISLDGRTIDNDRYSSSVLSLLDTHTGWFKLMAHKCLFGFGFCYDVIESE